MAVQFFALSWLIVVVWVLSRATLPPLDVVFAAVALLGVLALRRRRFVPFAVGCVAALISLGIALHNVHERQLQVAQIATDLRLHVRISDVPKRTSSGLRFKADVIRCQSCSASFGPQQLLLNWYGHPQSVGAGELWAMTVRLKPISSLKNPGSFDRAPWSLANGLDAQGYVRSEPRARQLTSASVWSVAALRESLSGKLQQLPSASRGVALVEALTLGIKSGIEQSTWQLLRSTGTSHLMAISGLHVMLLAGWVYWAMRKFIAWTPIRYSRAPAAMVSIDRQLVALLAGFLVALAYAMLAGFALPVQRAVIMLLVWVVASWRFRSISPLTGLAVALVAVLATQVFSPLSPGLWLSFGTVAVIFYLHRGHQHGHGHGLGGGGDDDASDDTLFRVRLHQLWSRTVGALRTHFLLGMVLLPVTAWFFQAGSLAAPLANLVAVPFVGFVVVPLCFLVVLATAIVGESADPLLVLVQHCIEALLWFLQKIALIDYSSVSMSMPHPGVMALCLLGVIVGLSPRGCGLRWFAVPLILPAVLFNLQRADIDGFEVHVLDVGQGLSALVLTDNHTLLFDTGGKLSSSNSMFEAVVMPYLYTLGRRHIDTLVVSHGDEDHAFGVADVMRRFPDVQLIAGSGLPENQQPLATSCLAGMVWSHDDVHFSILHPGASDRGSDNDSSCVLLVHQGASRVLFTGDIERHAENILSRRLGSFPVDLLIAPHHGSNTSSTAYFLSLITPEYVVFPAGSSNRYGFPHSAVQLRYKSVGAKLLTTGMVGAVSFRFTRSGLLGQPVTWWQTRRRFWHGFINPVCSELFAGRTQVLRGLELARKGQALCGK